MTEAKTVRLGDLAPDPVAVDGRGDRLKKIDDLLANIPELGQQQSLRVRPWAGGSIDGRTPLYGVTQGNRRLATFCKLRDDGGSIQGVVVTDDFPVHVLLGDEDDGAAFKGTVAENVQRLPETVVGEFRAFAKMAETSKVKEIASTFGVSEKRVQQRLKLAALHPDVIKALEDGKIKLDAAEAFTLVEPDKQAAFLKKAVGYQLEEYYIRREFTEKLINGGSAIAQLIGVEAYKKAGGKVLGDVFTDQAYWISKDLIDKLLKAHWETEVAKWTAEGWSFVETADEFCRGDNWTLQNQHEHLKPEGGSKKVPEFTAAQKAKAGVVYFVDGRHAPHVGVKRAKKQGYRSPVQEPDLDDPPYQAREVLGGVFARAMAAPLAADPLLAMRLLVATLMEGGGYHSDSPLQIERRFEFADEEESAAKIKLDTAIEMVRAMSMDDLIGKLTGMVAGGIEVDDEVSTAVYELINPKIEFDPKAFFEQTTKPFILLALKDMTDPASGEKAPKTAEETLARAVQRATDTGWLPPQLRMPGYAGPAFITGPGEEQLQAAE